MILLKGCVWEADDLLNCAVGLLTLFRIKPVDLVNVSLECSEGSLDVLIQPFIGNRWVLFESSNEVFAIWNCTDCNLNNMTLVLTSPTKC